MSERVLVVEDNEALAENIAELLRDEGMTVTICLGAHEGLSAAAERGFELAIVDIGLAGNESGLDLAPRLKRHSAHGEIVLMTGNATLHSALQAIRSGVYAYLPKPFEPEELVVLARRALAQVALKRERQALAERLASSEALYRGVVETVEACILGLDREGKVRFANRFASECLGVLPSELNGRAVVELCDARGARDFARAIQRAEVGQTVREVETRHETPSGTKTVRWTLTVLHADSFERAQRTLDDESHAPPPSLLAAGQDITERLALEQQSAEAQALGAMGTLATSLAHEIRNPLNAAKLQLELVTRRAKRASESAVREQIEEPVKLVRTELERLSDLLEDFLSLARPRPPVRRPLRVSELFDAVVALEEPLARSIGVSLTSSAATDLTVRADADKLKQVLINLVRNAIDALNERGHGHIALTAEKREDGSALLRVIDDGPGIPAEVLDDVFKPFVTSKPAGTGLGLAIVHRIVSQHGGEVSVAPSPAGGTTVSFTIGD